MKSSKVKVSDRALLARINRLLDKQGDKLLKSRSERSRLDLGDYYIIDASHNVITSKNIDLEKIGRELKVLKPYEELE